MDTLLIRRRRPIGEPVPAAAGAGRRTHDGTAGAGRIIASLLDLGVAVDAVHQLVLDPESSAADLGALDLGRPYERVILGSHLVNLPDEETRLGFLSVSRRHLATDGTLLLEHHPIDWAETAEPTPATPGAALGMVDVRPHPPYVSAVSVYDVGGRVLRQPFTARVLSDRELAAALAKVGLAVTSRLGPTWLIAGPRKR